MILCLQKGLVYIWRWHFVLAVLDPKVGHTMDVLSPFISVLSFWLTLPRRVLSTSWCYPSKPCVVFLVCVHITFTFCCCNLLKSKLIALKKPGKLTEFFQLQLCIKWGHVSPSREQLRTIFRSTVKDQGYPVCCRCARPYLEGGSSDEAFRTHYCSNFLQVHRPTY